MRVFFATPCHRATPQALRAIANWTIDMVDRAGLVGAACEIIGNNAWLDSARAELVYRFLQSPADAMMWRDDDINFGPEVVRRLVDWAPPVAIVPYRTRLPPHGFTHRIDTAGKVRTAGMGATWVRRDVLETLVAKNPGLLYDEGGHICCALFHHTFVDDYDDRLRPIRRLAKEDESFFLRVLSAGYSIDVLAGAQVLHAGIPSIRGDVGGLAGAGGELERSELGDISGTSRGPSESDEAAQ